MTKNYARACAGGPKGRRKTKKNMANIKKTVENFRLTDAAKAELQKNLENIENEILKTAGREVLGGYGDPFGQAHASAGWLKTT